MRNIGQNKIPTINKFLQNLDKDKKGAALAQSSRLAKLTALARDARIDQELRQRKAPHGDGAGDAVPHSPTSSVKGAKSVTDPVTGRQVEVCIASLPNTPILIWPFRLPM